MRSSQFWKIKTVDGKEMYARTNCKITLEAFKETFCDLVKEVVAVTREDYIKATGEDI